MEELIRKNNDDLSRRRFLSYSAKSLLGVGFLPTIAPTSVFAQDDAPAGGLAPSGRRPTARKVIYLYMSGGMTHLDTFDPKPGTAQGGPVEAIRTNAEDVFISEYLPNLAHHMDKAALIRGLSTTQGAHEQGNYFMHSSYTMRGTIRHPGMGAWIQKLDGRINRTIPASVVVGGGSRGGGAGWMESRYAPLVISNPTDGLKNSKKPEDITDKEYEDRLMLANEFDEAFHQRYNHKKVRAYADMYDDAIRLMKSEDLKAFDLELETPEMREAYGNNGFGQGCLLARRLIENDVRFVEVNLGGWDTHSNNFNSVPARAAILDQALATLLSDLERRGLLDETLVVVATEFGRTPNINQNDGRDHYPKAFSGLLAGGGIQGGRAFGKTDEGGMNVIENKLMVPDFNASIAYALGLPTDKIVYSPSKRPFQVAHKGQPATELF